MLAGASLTLLQSDGGLKNKTRQGRWRATYCCYKHQYLNATALRWTATIVRNGRDILNHGDLDA
jgi:hypothetical protein